MPHQPVPSVVDADACEFIQRRVSIIVAGRDARNVPSSARAYGCRVTGDGRALTVFVRRPQAQRLLADVESNGRVAAVFSRPTTARTLQFKGDDARIEALASGDPQVVAEWVGSYVVELASLGFMAPFVHAFCATRPDELAAITFTPGEGYAQTPGPGAGARLDAVPPAAARARPGSRAR